MNAINELKIRYSSCPIYRSFVKQTPDYPIVGDSNNLYLGEGVHVMLNRNLHCDSGFVNSLKGVVTRVVLKQGGDQKFDQPEFVMMNFEDAYRGRRLENGSIPIPIAKEKCYFDDIGKSVSYTYIPLQLAYSDTTRKQ